MEKQLIKELIEEQKYRLLVKLARKKHNKVLRYILLSLYEDYYYPRHWYAVEALGVLAKDLAEKDEELYRRLINRFLWSMNNESGNVPWGIPEAIGILIASKPFLFGKFTPKLISSCLNNPICHRGMLWSVGKIGKVEIDLINPFIDKLLCFLENDEPELLGHGIWAFGEIKCKKAVPKIKVFKNDQRIITIYKGKKLKKESIGSLAEKALLKIERFSLKIN